MPSTTDSKRADLIRVGSMLNLVRGASMLGVSPHTLRSWTRTRKISFFRVGRRIVFDAGDLQKFLAANRVEAR